MGLTIRWTVGDVSLRGFETLACSIAGARSVFGDAARYVVCVNTLDLAAARSRAGAIAQGVEWRDATGEIPAWLEYRLDRNMAEGVAWKFAPPRLSPDDHELRLDNDVILWRMPEGVQDWLYDGDSLLIAEDVRACYGIFARSCPVQPRNSGIVGLPPGYPLEAELRRLAGGDGEQLSSETDEQGLQVALVTAGRHRVVSSEEVSICGLYPPHREEFGSCGAHFVGGNVKDPAHEQIWDAKKADVERLLFENCL